MDSLNANKVLEFLKLVNSLKHTARRGWLRMPVQNPESIAGHMYSMGMMTFLIGNDPNLDRLRCLQLALVHDLAECIVGDIIPHDNIPVDVKHELEDTAMKKLTADLGSDVGNMIYELYKEYEKKETPEAKFVKDLDRFDLILTAFEYEQQNNTNGKLQEFFDATNGQFQHPFVRELVAALAQQRQKDEKQ